MMTTRLFDSDPALRAFTAGVTACEQTDKGWNIILDRTAFFPEGGGQMPDRGTLDGQTVLDVHDHAGVISHLVSSPIAPGTIVEGQVDGEHRLDMMQQHSGEHILSGLICRLHSCDNVGFHIGPAEVTIDFNTPLTMADVLEAEQLANAVIWRDIPVRAWFPDAEELAALTYRSKKELTGTVRIVAIEGADTCACCGTHVASTGMVGQIKVIDLRNYKSGVRITLLCGARALAYENERLSECRRVSRLTSAPLGTVPDAVQRLLDERDALRMQCETLALRLLKADAAAQTGPVRICVCDGLPAGQLRKAASSVTPGAVYAMVLLPRGEDGWSYALTSEQMDVRPPAAALSQAFGGKGGGPKDMVQGVLSGGTPDEIRTLLEGLIPPPSNR